MKSSFNRPNIFYEVRKKHRGCIDEIANYISEHPDDCGIVYCLSRRDCETVADELKSLLGEETVSYYHAGIELQSERADRHIKWLEGKTRVIVATVAFGMVSVYIQYKIECIFQKI